MPVLGETLKLLSVGRAAFYPGTEPFKLRLAGPLLGIQTQQPVGCLLLDILRGISADRAVHTVETAGLLCFTALRVQVAASFKSGRQCKVLQ